MEEDKNINENINNENVDNEENNNKNKYIGRRRFRKYFERGRYFK